MRKYPATIGALTAIWAAWAVLAMGHAVFAQAGAWEGVEPDAVPAGTWPVAIAADPQAVMAVSLAEADSTVRAYFRNVERYKEFAIVAVTPDSVLYARLDLEDGRAFGGRGDHSGSARIMRSFDRGLSWELVLLRQGPAGQGLVLVPDARDPLRPLIGAGDGLWIGAERAGDSAAPSFQASRAVHMPRRRVAVATALMDPHRPGVVYAATRDRRPLRFGVEDILSVPSLLRGVIGDDAYAGWEAIGPLPDGETVALGMAPEDGDWLYARLADGRVARLRLPAPHTPEDFGWQALAVSDVPAAIDFARPEIDPTPYLRVSPDYAAARVMFHSFGVRGFGGYVFAQDGGVLYAQYHMSRTGLRFWRLARSVDGGLSWQGVASYDGTTDFNCAACVVALLDIRGQLTFDSQRFNPERVAGTWDPQPLTAWAQDPVDPLTFYIGQAGDTALWRKRDQQWQPAGAGLPIDLQVDGVAVDSSATLYVRMFTWIAGTRSHERVFRRRETPRPFALRDPQVRPDTLRQGEPFVLTVRRVALAADAAPEATLHAQYGGQPIALADDGRAPDETRGDGVYTGQGQLDAGQRLGYDGLPVLLQIPDQPLAGASARASFVVVPADAVPIYGDQLAAGWSVDVVDGAADLAAAAPGGGVAHRIEGEVAYEYEGPEVNPFGYALDMRVWSPSGGGLVGVNDFDFAEEGVALAAGEWTRVAIPIGRLYDSPPIQFTAAGEELAPLIGRLRVRAAEPVYLDDVQLLPPRGQRPTAIAQTPAAAPSSFALAQNYPNPFNAATTIAYHLPQAGRARLVVYDILGRPVRVLVDGPRGPGPQQAVWDGRDDAGVRAGSGVYFYRLQTATASLARRLLLLK